MMLIDKKMDVVGRINAPFNKGLTDGVRGTYNPEHYADETTLDEYVRGYLAGVRLKNPSKERNH